MPAGVTWGPPAATSAPAPQPRPTSTSGTITPELPIAQPTAHPALPSGNYDPDPREGEIWETGVASFYGPREQGRDTASGEKFNYHDMTAAHRLLPLGTVIRVTDLKTGKSVKVRINDRGPFWPNRLLDLSWGAAQRIGDEGLDRVRIQIVKLPDPLPTGVYTVQVGWFTDADKLQQCRELMQRTLDRPVIAFGSDEGRWLRYAKSVRLPRDEAMTAVRALRARDYQAYLVRLN